MIAGFFPTNEGTIMVLAINGDDLVALMGGEEPEVIDLEAIMAQGIALPSYVKIISIKDTADFEERMKKIHVALGGNEDSMEISIIPDVEDSDDDE